MQTRLHTTRRPAHPGFNLPRPQMAGYLAGAVGTVALLGAPQAEAAVTAVTFGFGTEFNAADGFNLYWTVGPGFGTLAGDVSADHMVLGNYTFGSVYHTASLGFNHGLARFFANNTVIGDGGNEALGNSWFHHYSDPAINFPTDQLNKNIGFQTSTNHWGWANVSWTEATKTLAINEAWVESVAYTPITINVAAVPEPSRALLALAGLGGVALRRRRKQVV